MHRAWRLPALAAMLNVCLGAGVAAGQTVIVRKAPAGSRVDVVVNAATVATATVDAIGDAKVGFDLVKTAGKPEIDANIFLDTCDTVRRVVIVERDRLPPAPEAGCTRRQISGVFWVRPVNSIVIDAGGANPTLLLIKGCTASTLISRTGPGRRHWAVSRSSAAAGSGRSATCARSHAAT